MNPAAVWLLAAAMAAVPDAPAPAPTPQPSLRIAVLPFGGGAAAGERRLAGDETVTLLRSLRGLEVVALVDLVPVLGSLTAERFLRCPDDACRADSVSALKLSHLLLGEIETGSLRLRWVEVTPTGVSTKVRVSRTLVPGSALSAELAQAVAELFPDLEQRGVLVVESADTGAAVEIDGRLAGVVPLAPLELRAGDHRVRISRPGYARFEQQVTVRLGERSFVRADLSKNRQSWPLYLGGAAIAASALGLALGLVAQSTADDWKAACASGRCAPGFTRERYAGDDSSLGALRFGSNAAYVAGGGLLIAGVLGFLFDPGVEEEQGAGSSGGQP